MNPGGPTAAQIAEQIASGATTVAAVAEGAIAAAAAAAHLNLFTHFDPEGIRARAERLDRIVAKGLPAGPLGGVPVVIKDMIDQRGLPTTAGSSFYSNTPDRAAAVTERLETAGALIIGRTGLHEFAFGFSSENPWWGSVRNPWDPDASPGGSSGGSGAAVASGVAPLGIGTDTGGSVRVPASLCGLVGLKVSHGRVSLRGVFPVAPSVDTVGPLAASVGDAALAYSVIAGFDHEDPWSAPRAVDGPRPPATLHGLNMAVPKPWVDRPLDSTVSEGFRRALEALRAQGVRVEAVDLPWLMPDRRMNIIVGAEVASTHRGWFGEHPQRYGPDVARRMRRAMSVDGDDLVEALRWRAGIRHRAEQLFSRFDYLVTPTTAVHRKRIGLDEVETEAGPEPHGRALSEFVSLVNHLGLPALAVPLAGGGRPPPSLQLIGPRWSEACLLEMGAALEASGIVRGPDDASGDRPS